MSKRRHFSTKRLVIECERDTGKSTPCGRLFGRAGVKNTPENWWLSVGPSQALSTCNYTVSIFPRGLACLFVCRWLPELLKLKSGWKESSCLKTILYNLKKKGLQRTILRFHEDSFWNRFYFYCTFHSFSLLCSG